MGAPDLSVKGSSRVAIVTGASRGLGALIASKLDETGYRTARSSLSSPRKVDVRDTQQVSRYVEEVIEENGRIDALVNNAGYLQGVSRLWETSDSDLLNCFQTDTLGPFFMMRAVIPTMLQQNEGVVVNISSKSAIYSVPGLAAYSAAKAALVSLTQAAAKELRNTNVLCVAVCPSGMKTGMRESAFGSADAGQQQSPVRVADIVCEIVASRTADGQPVRQGTCLVVRRDRVEVREMEDG